MGLTIYDIDWAKTTGCGVGNIACILPETACNALNNDLVDTNIGFILDIELAGSYIPEEIYAKVSWEYNGVLQCTVVGLGFPVGRYFAIQVNNFYLKYHNGTYSNLRAEVYSLSSGVPTCYHPESVSASVDVLPSSIAQIEQMKVETYL